MSASREYPFAPAIIKEDIPLALAFRLEERKPELPGVAVRVDSLRYYPYKETASHLIGYIGKIGPEEYKAFDHARFGMTSFIGRAGMEKIFDDRLRGWRGGRQIEVDARGEMIRVLSEKKPEPGEDLHLTVDLEFQKKIMELIQNKHASVAVLDLANDGLVALASMPAYDPNVFVAPNFSNERLELLKNPASPMLDRGVSSVYPPGSVFKLVTALAALETGKITPNTRFYCPGTFRLNTRSRAFHCWSQRGHGSLDLYQAVERSCNVYFFNVARRLSAEDLSHFAHELGLGEMLKLETTHIVAGLVPDSEWKKSKLHDVWYKGETLSFAIGQSYLLVSPLQILRLTSIIAKEGKKIEPTLLVEKAKEQNEKSRIAVREENLKILKRAMLKVVQSDYGTGQLARVDFTKMAAKTGTAQAPPKTAHSWMTGFFPYEKPEIAFVVFVEHGGSGGITAAKIVKDMVQTWRQMHEAKVV
jgi:penicillin-binding protein 2